MLSVYYFNCTEKSSNTTEIVARRCNCEWEDDDDALGESKESARMLSVHIYMALLLFYLVKIMIFEFL